MGSPALRRRRSALAAGFATFAMAVGFAALPAEAAPPPRDVDYVALGDSYTAGTGAGAFTTTGPCVQTHGGYVDVFAEPALVNLVSNAACHGSLLSQDSVVDHDPNIPSVQQQISSLVNSKSLTRDTELVSITAGAQ